MKKNELVKKLNGFEKPDIKINTEKVFEGFRAGYKETCEVVSKYSEEITSGLKPEKNGYFTGDEKEMESIMVDEIRNYKHNVDFNHKGNPYNKGRIEGVIQGLMENKLYLPTIKIMSSCKLFDNYSISEKLMQNIETSEKKGEISKDGLKLIKRYVEDYVFE